MKAADKEASPRLFQNAFLEALTHTTPTITIVHYGSIIVLLFAAGAWYAEFPAWRMIATYVGGVLFWTLFEYIAHRYLFHITEHVHGKAAERFQYMVHGVHHDHPRDESRVFMPPVPGTIMSAVLFGISWLIMGLDSSFFFMSGLISGYLAYTFIHYSVHNKPPYPPLRKLWQHHALHHYRYPDKAFGVSSPLWDYVFRTMPPKDDPKKEREQKQKLAA